VSIGDALAEARSQAGLTVAQVSQQTRIRETIISGIEADDYSQCGADFYVRGYIRSIAKVVGTDPAPLIREYDTAYRTPGVLSAVSMDELLTPPRAQTATAPRATEPAPTPAPAPAPGPPQAPGRPPAAGRPPAPGRGRPHWIVLLGLVVVLVAAGVVAYKLIPGSRHAASATSATSSHSATGAARSASATPSPSPTAAPSPTVSPTPTPAVQALIPASAAAFGPYGAGQGDNPGHAALAIDSSAATAWRTDWYTTDRFGGLYRGTGLLLDMGRPVTITTVRVTLGSIPGADIQLRVGAAPSLADLPPVAGAANAGGTTVLTPGTPVSGRYVLIWFTKLPADAAGTFQASVYGVSLQGHP
jgi:cytoskeletal protein RodZ